MGDASASRAGMGAAPVESANRITTLDAIRGVAILGILAVNVVDFGLGQAAYSNVSASTPQTALDWLIGILGRLFFDHQMLALFSMLFGAGVVLFADRARAKGGHPVALSLWRFFVLAMIGFAHSQIWAGDILLVFALCAPFVLVARKLPPKVLLSLGGLVTAAVAVSAIAAQLTIPPSGEGLGWYWGVEGEVSDTIGLWMIIDGSFRSLGAMLIGVGLVRTGFLSGGSSERVYRNAIWWGLAIGLPLSVGGFAYVAINDFDPSVALVGAASNTLASIPIALAYVGIIVLWHQAYKDRPFDLRIRYAGMMTLTNYLAQTVLAVVTFDYLFPDFKWSRTTLAVFVAIVWALQLWWSQAWLTRFRFGPAEWAWRVATYRRLP